MACPLLWVNKLQTKIFLLTMEVEYEALSQAMREILQLVTMLHE